MAVTCATALVAPARRLTRSAPLQSEPGPQTPAPEPEKPRPEPRPVIMPTVTGSNGEQIDVMSRLLKDRILLLGSEVNDEVANVLVAQMLYLANEDPEGDITLYINSPGGSVSAGMAIYDTMQFIPCDVSTVCFGMAASMGAFLLGAGAKGKRKSLPNARIMIHQPLGGAQGQAADIEIQAKEILFTKAVINTYMAVPRPRPYPSKLRGAMDSVSDFESGGCGFESRRGCRTTRVDGINPRRNTPASRRTNSRRTRTATST